MIMYLKAGIVSKSCSYTKIGIPPSFEGGTIIGGIFFSHVAILLKTMAIT